MNTKGHLTPEGLEKIMEIKTSMNANRIIDTMGDIDSAENTDSDALDFVYSSDIPYNSIDLKENSEN